MFANWIWPIVLVFLMFFNGGCLSGLSGFPSEMGQAANVLAEMVRDQGVMDKFLGQLEGNIYDPGIETYVKVSSGIHLVGTQGSIDLTTEGTGTQLPTGVKQALIDQLSGPLSDDQRVAILTILGWNRIESAHNPVP